MMTMMTMVPTEADAGEKGALRRDDVDATHDHAAIQRHRARVSETDRLKKASQSECVVLLCTRGIQRTIHIATKRLGERYKETASHDRLRRVATTLAPSFANDTNLGL
jgi:hypothetical protein